MQAGVFRSQMQPVTIKSAIFAYTNNNIPFLMNQKHKAKVEKRTAKQEKQAQMVIWGIIIGLIVLALAFVITYSMSF